MKIGFDATPLLHGERAVRRNSRNLLKELIKIEGVDWRALYFDRKADTPGRLGITDERVCRLPMRLLTPAWRGLGWPNLETIAGDDMDIFYAPDLYFPPAKHTKVMTTIRGVAYLAIPELCAPEKVALLTKAFEYAREHADYFLAVSESTRQDMLEHTDIPAECIFVSSHGVDPQFFPIEKMKAREDVKKRYGVERTFFLFVGAIATHKNVSLLVNALHQSPALQNVDLVLAGPHEQPFTTTLRVSIEKAGLSKRVHLIGAVGQENNELATLYSAATALLFPTFYEGWCAPPLEAMACGTPVISTQTPSVQEVVGGAAVLLPVDDVDAWRVQMIRVVEDVEWKALLVKQGLQHVQQHTWNSSASRLFGVMREIVRREE
ncbi:MAG: glycosyltransferase family 1 protein [Mariprofundales bacterium]|nr:glycosyltransferase family 1 protein [Mariprofundales bacterium]